MRSLRTIFLFAFAVAALTIYSIHIFGGGLYLSRPLLNSTVYQLGILRKKFSGLAGPFSALLLSHGFLGNARRTKMILLWTPFFGDADWIPPLTKMGCPVSDCVIVSNRTLLQDSDAVIFHWRDIKVMQLPKEHLPYQTWILLNEESPEHSPAEVLAAIAPQINWTVSYRRDSDIHAPYGRVRKKILEEQIVTGGPSKCTECVGKEGTNNTKQLVAWLVSHCKTPAKREEFVKELQRYVPVSIFGKCGDLKCPTENRIECYKYLSERYKFYLSFENSICKDYATEKLFYAMLVGIVPVVFGGADYEHILPPHSFIDALSFQSPKELAQHLLMLDQNETLYNEYLTWRDDYIVEDVGFNWICDVCEKLDNVTATVHRKLSRWWFEDAHCRSWTGDFEEEEEDEDNEIE